VAADTIRVTGIPYRKKETITVAPSPERAAIQAWVRRTPSKYSRTKMGNAATNEDAIKLPWMGV
jgi:hypothetical protein